MTEDSNSETPPVTSDPPNDFRIEVDPGSVESYEGKEIYTSVIGFMATVAILPFEDTINSRLWEDRARPLLPRIYVSNKGNARIKHSIWAFQQLLKQLGDITYYPDLTMRVFVGTEQVLWCSIFRHATPPLEGEASDFAAPAVARRDPQAIEARERIRFQTEYSADAAKNAANTMLTSISEAIVQLSPIDVIIEYVTAHSFDISLLVWSTHVVDVLDTEWVINGLLSAALYLYDHNSYRDCVTYMLKANEAHDIATISVWKGELPPLPPQIEALGAQTMPVPPGRMQNDENLIVN